LQILGIGGYVVGSTFGIGPSSSLQIGAVGSNGLNGAYLLGSVALFLDCIHAVIADCAVPRAWLEFIGGFFFLLAGIGPYTKPNCTEFIGLWSWLVGSCAYLVAHLIELYAAKSLTKDAHPSIPHIIPSMPLSPQRVSAVLVAI
jgi:hypothetical protein